MGVIQNVGHHGNYHTRRKDTVAEIPVENHLKQQLEFTFQDNKQFSIKLDKQDLSENRIFTDGHFV